ncbi:MAG TPA: hypothetical protein VFO67_03955 [Gemmatimonadales bacterium]|nr:hypothetical protein [Gemmatimonadales bacterium]
MTMELQNVVMALLVGFASGVIGSDAIGLWLIKLGKVIRRRGK